MSSSIVSSMTSFPEDTVWLLLEWTFGHFLWVLVAENVLLLFSIAQNGRARAETLILAKVGLAKVGHDRGVRERFLVVVSSVSPHSRMISSTIFTSHL